MINNENNIYFKLEGHRKSINNGLVRNEKGEGPKRYKESVINGFLIRVNKICSTDEQFYNEIDYIKKILTNNSYNSKLSIESTEKFLNNQNQAKLQRKNGHLKLFYEGQFHENYHIDEMIIKRNVKTKKKR